MIQVAGGVDVRGLLAQALLTWKPAPRRNLSDWAEEFFYLSPESAAEPGRWRTLPYQRGVMNAITDPDVVQVSWMKSARIGYTKCINATVGYYMHQDPCPIMVVQPTIEDAQGYSKEEIAPMLRDCPALSAVVPEPTSRDSDNTILLKRFHGGSLSMVGANSPRGFRRVSRKVVVFDEPDGYPTSAGSEGNPIQLGIRRTDSYWDRKIIAGSTPTIAGHSQIERLFLAGDQRRYYVPCPDCGEMQVLCFPNFTWPKGKPELAAAVCVACGIEIDHHHKRDMVASGEWRPGPHAQFPDLPAPEPFHGHASFHLWAGYSFSPNATWGQLASEFVAANAAGNEHLQTFVNTVLGEPWDDRGDAPEWHPLYARRESYQIGTCPRGVLFLTAGVDVQKDRLVYEVVGWDRYKRSWSVDAAVLYGDTSDLSNKDSWGRLNQLIDQHFPHESGRELPISMLAIDSGYNTNTVYGWARRFLMSRVIAVKGVASGSRLVGNPSKVDVTVSGRTLNGGYRVWPVVGAIAKSELYGWLALRAPTDEAKAEGTVDPAGYCHFPEYGEDYFRQLTAEHLVKHGAGFSWEPMPGRENHYLDARVYARSAAAVYGIDRFRDHVWDALEREFEGDKPPRLDATAETPAPAVPVSAPAARPWITPRRTGGWLKGGR